MADKQTHTYIGGERVPLRDGYTPPGDRRGASDADQMDAALERLKDSRDGRVPDGEDGSMDAYVGDVVRQSRPDPRETFVNAEAAHDTLTERAAEARRLEAISDREAADTAREAEQAQTQWSRDDVQVGQHFVQREQNLRARLQQMQQLAPYIPQAGEARERFQSAIAAAQQEAQAIEQFKQRAQRVAGEKSRHKARLELWSTVPELRNPQVRERFIGWAERKGIPRSVALSSTDPASVGTAFRKFEKEAMDAYQQHLDRPRKTTYTAGPMHPGGALAGEITVDGARDRLRRSGSMEDAMQLLTLSRERAREARK